jgi:hypothetical protein
VEPFDIAGPMESDFDFPAADVEWWVRGTAFHGSVYSLYKVFMLVHYSVSSLVLPAINATQPDILVSMAPLYTTLQAMAFYHSPGLPFRKLACAKPHMAPSQSVEISAAREQGSQSEALSSCFCCMFLLVNDTSYSKFFTRSD